MIRFLCLLLLSFSLGAQNSLEWSLDRVDFSPEGSYWSTSAKDISLEDFSFLGFSALSFQEPPLHIEIRFRKAGAWENWQAFGKQSHEELITDRQVWVLDLISHKIDAWQIRTKGRPSSELKLRLFIAQKEHAPSKASPSKPNLLATQICSCPQPNYCDRSCWCPNGDCPPPTAYTPTVPSHLIVHHSAGGNSSNNYPGVVAYYWDLHVNTNGWSDIGYNWLIDPNGQIYEGRGSGNTGAHFSCLNSGTLGICLIGDYRSTQPSTNSLQALSDLLLYESCSNNIDPADSSIHNSSQLVLRHISGHRDANPANVGCPSGTVCPGQVVYDKLDSIAIAFAQDNCLLREPEFGLAAGHHFYPVPSHGLLRCEAKNSPSKLRLIDGQGRTFNLKPGNANEWDLRKFEAGFYTLLYRLNDTDYQQKINIL